MSDETTPLLNGGGSKTASMSGFDPHEQFCMLIGIPEDDHHKIKYSQLDDRLLYGRASRKRVKQKLAYTFTATLSNTLLLAQVVLGATLTALGASESSHTLITIFGVVNTIIAGVVAYLKSRGQPMRARMFRDDLEHVVDEIENSKTMWMGIARHAHGYDEIDTEDTVSVRSEVARLHRLYESAVKKYMQNNPDMYTAGGVLDPITGLRSRPASGPAPPVVSTPAAGGGGGTAGTGAGDGAGAPPPAPSPPLADPDESPATSKNVLKKTVTAEDENKAKGDSKPEANKSTDTTDAKHDENSSSTPPKGDKAPEDSKDATPKDTQDTTSKDPQDTTSKDPKDTTTKDPKDTTPKDPKGTTSKDSKDNAPQDSKDTVKETPTPPAPPPAGPAKKAKPDDDDAEPALIK